jgi:outer membrane protein
MLRIRGLVVVPNSSARIDQDPNANVYISTSIVPELDVSYFFTPNFAAELILGVTPHVIDGRGSLNGIPIGRVWLLPPTLTFQYHLTTLGALKPYVGVGPNYTAFFNPTPAGLVITQMTVKSTWGVAFQAGFDYMLNKNLGLNVDVKKLYLRPDVSLNNGAFTGKVTIDPWLIGAGLTYKL